MKAEIEKLSQQNVLHRGYEGQNQETELVKSPSSGVMKAEIKKMSQRNVLHPSYEDQNQEIRPTKYPSLSEQPFPKSIITLKNHSSSPNIFNNSFNAKE